MTSTLPTIGAAPHRNLGGDTDPHGPDVCRYNSDPDAVRWFTRSLGGGGLSGLFRRGGRLVHCPRIDEDGYIAAAGEDDENGPATVSPATPELVSSLLVERYLVWKWAGGQKNPYRVETLFPPAVVRIALAVLDDAPRLRTLRGTTHTPMARRDGSILEVAGYDDGSGFLHLPTVIVPPVPEHPTAEQLAAATTFLRGLLADFAWAGEHDEANFLGALLTPLLRQLCPPPYKLVAIEARQPGSGKGLLARILRDVHGGVFRSEMPHDDAEMEKALSSILTCTTAPVVTFDNVSGVLRSSRLEGLLTSRVYSGRILGSTNHVDMVNDRLWTITGNNLAIAGDLPRRTLGVAIDPGVPNPEQRTGFRIPDLAGYVAEHRGAILHALLVLVRGWMVAGAPVDAHSSDDYARWAGTVRAILRVAGVPGQFNHTDSRRQVAVTDDDEWREFLEAVRGEFGEQPWTVKELLSKVHDGREAPFGGLVDTYGPEHPIPLDALPTELGEKVTRARAGIGPVAKSLGMWLRNRDGRWVGDMSVRRSGTDRKGIAEWRIETYRVGGP